MPFSLYYEGIFLHITMSERGEYRPQAEDSEKEKKKKVRNKFFAQIGLALGIGVAGAAVGNEISKAGPEKVREIKQDMKDERDAKRREEEARIEQVKREVKQRNIQRVKEEAARGEFSAIQVRGVNWNAADEKESGEKTKTSTAIPAALKERATPTVPAMLAETSTSAGDTASDADSEAAAESSGASETPSIASADATTVDDLLHQLAREEGGLAAGWPRMEAASEAMLGIPYEEGALGEEAAPDADPRLRWDKMDCVTFIETMIAFGHAGNLEQCRAILDDIRYADQSPRKDFDHRLHIMETQWIPDMIAKGYIRDVNQAVANQAGLALKKLKIQYTQTLWDNRKQLRDPDLPWEVVTQAEHTTAYLSIQDVMDNGVMDQLPAGTLLVMMHKMKPGDVTAVHHMGVVVVKEGVRHVRHARQNKGVEDEDAGDYLKRHKAIRATGVSFYKVTNNESRTNGVR